MMFQDCRNKLLLGDTLSVLKSFPDRLVDLSVTSTPYNKQEKNDGRLVGKVVYSDFADKMPEYDYQQNQIAVLNETYRVTKHGGSCFYNHKTRWSDGEMFHPMDWLRKTDWIVRQELVWDRTIAGNIRGWRYWQVDERVYWLYKPVDWGNKIGVELESKDAKLSSVWRAVPEYKNPHPAPFPLWLPARIILSMLPQAEVLKPLTDKILVLDPYVGSGTTAVAAKLLGADYVGIDISPKYLDSARKRLAESENERAIVNKETALHVVSKPSSERDSGRKIGCDTLFDG